MGPRSSGLYAGVTYVSPQRSYDTITGVNATTIRRFPRLSRLLAAPFTQTDVQFADGYTVPYASVGGRIGGDVNCVGSYSQPFGADSEYYGLITFQTASQHLTTNEYGLTCAYGFDMSKGRLSIIGGRLL